MALMYAKIKIEGTKPLLFHLFNKEELSLERKARTGVAGNDPAEWERTHSLDDKNRFYVDSSYAFGCIREAAKYTKMGHSSIQSKVAATLQILSRRITFNRTMPVGLTTNENEKVYLDIRSVRNPNTKGRNIRYRVALNVGWETEFEVIWDNTIVSTHQMEAVLRDAGTLVGIADGRAIGYGRFKISSFKVMSYDEFEKKNSKVV